MAELVIMPKQGQSVESCIITEWHKKKGDKVAVGDVLFAYETDKASFEEESKFDGVLLEVFYEEGDEVPVLENVCIIGEEGEDISGLLASAGAAKASGESQEQEVVSEQPAEKEETSVQVPSESHISDRKSQTAGVSPRARNMAEKEALPLDGIQGTGPKGRVIARDVEAALKERPKLTGLAKEVAKAEGLTAPAEGSGPAGTVKAADLTSSNPVYSGDFEIKPLSNMRKLIAKAMHSSLQNSAQLTHHLGADARNILALRQKVKKAMEEGYPTNITINDMVCMAVIKALKKFPQVNSHFLGDSMKIFNKVHLGLAVDTERGLMVPAVKNADDLSIQGLSNQMKEIAGACRTGSIDPDLLASEAASFTVSNLGNYGVEMFTPVINLPQSAILGVNTIVPRPKDLGGGVYGFVPYMGLSLTYDHRALDGGEATRFLKQIAIEIETLEIDL
ncbi:MAG: 2-oxo acid dehydrogenase subunit E2 [Chlorobi bacterium]|nr:2-oxo acid dehydrogenase subunit E2 [Chlorobiota bacterium]